jgi:hypothetical protein
MPIVVILLGGAAVLISSWNAKRRRERLRPGE